MSNTSFWQRIGLHDWFLKKEATVTREQVPVLTPDDVYKYIIEKFKESIGQLSFANRIVFFHEFIICFNPEDYNGFMANKKGIFGLIIHESVNQFYTILKGYRAQGKTVQPSSNKWVFRFVSHPDYPRGDKSFIGKLLPGNAQQKEENLRVTYIPRQTGIAQTFDINPDILDGFTFYSEGYYEVTYREDLVVDEGNITNTEPAVLARLETIVPDKEYAGKKIEYLMKDEEITVSGKDEQRTGTNIFRIPSDWVNSPHLQIRHNQQDNKFQLASFGEKTVLNEQEVAACEPGKPTWVELPVNSRIVLNGIVGINIFKA
ncbi:hypothetical protein EXU57_10800 [Segetibacter sp. 3557_3]|uniref:hypothetical protein n=1 Tax=Segetibacter sp. 3557_3 TaxID=2547429 RepID=UPI001058AD04|nr:hypothetical protein [Segetibacter sp. 3557_3]TDH26570.1 hypothetical protein EXU57_10800 [Segetibacter sp. 3557_3]